MPAMFPSSETDHFGMFEDRIGLCGYVPYLDDLLDVGALADDAHVLRPHLVVQRDVVPEKAIPFYHEKTKIR